MNINNIKIGIFILLILGLASCKENELAEITKLQVDRAFSPTNLAVSVVGKTGVRVTWTAVKNADSYTIEFFANGTLDFSGTPIKKVEGILFSQAPYTVTGFAGATMYSVRLKAIGKELEDSKYVTATFTTDAEQIFNTVKPADITANSVVLTWPAGEVATSVTLAPGNITHTLTVSEIASGSVTLNGLVGETLYTAKLLNGTNTRGTITFTTLLDLGGALAVSPTDDLSALVLNAKGGEVFALLSGTYNINADIIVSKSISIKGARPTDKPLIKGLNFKIKANAALSLKDLNLEGAGTAANQTIVYDEASDNAYGNLSVENCIIKNYGKGFIYVNVKALIESVTIKNSIFSNIEGNGGDFIDFRTGIAKTVTFTNNTVYNSVLARDLFRMDVGGSTNFSTITSVITVSGNTFNAICNGISNRLFYIRLAKNEIYFSKNIVANSGGIIANQTATSIIAANFTANNYFNAPTFISGSTATTPKYDTGTFTTLDPGFKAPSSGDFTLSNETLKSNGIGDPRWR